MNQFPRGIASVCCLAVVFAGTCMPVQAGNKAGPAASGATELTQIANNLELVAQLAKQAEMVSQQVNTNMTALNQYATMQKNLQQINQADLTAQMQPYQTQMAGFSKLQQSVDALKKSASNTDAVVSGRVAEANSLGLPLKTYLGNEIALANRRGGVYKQRVDQDLASIDDLAVKATNLRSVAAQTQSVTGGVQGLQNLAQLSSIAAGELLEIKAALLAQAADRNADRAAKSSYEAQMNGVSSSAAGAVDGRGQRNTGIKFGAQLPWQ